MRYLLHFALLATMLLTILYLAIGHENAALYDHPLAVIGVGLIGLGLCKQHRSTRPKPATVPVQ